MLRCRGTSPSENAFQRRHLAEPPLSSPRNAVCRTNDNVLWVCGRLLLDTVDSEVPVSIIPRHGKELYLPHGHRNVRGVACTISCRRHHRTVLRYTCHSGRRLTSHVVTAEAGEMLATAGLPVANATVTPAREAPLRVTL